MPRIGKWQHDGKDTTVKKTSSKQEKAAEREQRKRDGVYEAGRDWKRGSVAIGDLLGKVADPLCARRGFASSALLKAWPDLIGAHFSDCTLPEKIQWNNDPLYGQTGVLTIRIDGPRGVYLQHEEYQIIERINRFFGFNAIHQIKIVQGPIARRTHNHKPDLPDLTPQQDRQLRGFIQEFDDPALQAAVTAMGRGVLRRVLRDKKLQKAPPGSQKF
ncbi:MAG: DciA family protein [Pseudomonadota bacterium]